MKEKHLTIYEIRQLKAHVESIEKSGKVFSLFGGYNTIRKSLMSRGWLEKVEKPSKVYKQPEESSFSGDDDGIDEVDEPEHEDIKQCQITARLLRNTTSNLIWTLRSNSIDYKFLEKHQIINHFRGSWSLTTKAGLLLHLKLLSWYSDVDEVTIYPRAYRLFEDDDLAAFTDDFRLTACIGFLKILSAKADSVSPATFVSENVSFAILQVESFIRFHNNEDLEDPVENISPERWNNFLENYQNLKNGKYKDFGIPKATLSHCSNLLSQLANIYPQDRIDGTRNIWIVKPAARSRGRGIFICDKYSDVVKVADTTYSRQKAKFVVQKYIERPLLIYSTKFDIRQWFLVTDWNPLTIWIYKQSYLRFCSHQFSLIDFHASIHLNNNAIQKYYSNEVNRSSELPDNNMWPCERFQQYLSSIGHPNEWKDRIYPNIKKFIICAVMCGQESIDQRKNSFELYGADFIIDEQLNPWLIEINSSPSMDSSTSVTEMLCSAVLDDTIKVVCDRRISKGANVGDYELLYRGPIIQKPHYSGSSLGVDSIPIRSPKVPKQLPPLHKIEVSSKQTEKNGKLEKQIIQKTKTNTDNSTPPIEKKVPLRKCCPLIEYKTNPSPKPYYSYYSSKKNHKKKFNLKKSSKRSSPEMMSISGGKSNKSSPKMMDSSKDRSRFTKERIARKSKITQEKAGNVYQLRDEINEQNLKLLAGIKSQVLRKPLSFKMCLPFFHDNISLPDVEKNGKTCSKRCQIIQHIKSNGKVQSPENERKTTNCRIRGLNANFCLDSNFWRAQIN